jgi:hypothetical protein
VCVNAAVEESTIGGRAAGALLPHDEFVRDHLSPRDVVIASLGGNDIALKPTLATVWHMLWLAKCARKGSIASDSAWGLGLLSVVCCLLSLLCCCPCVCCLLSDCLIVCCLLSVVCCRVLSVAVP